MEKMREEFEAWAISQGLCVSTWVSDYFDCRTNMAWKSWQASRAAQCVELPRIGVLHHSTTYNAPEMREALDAAGIRYT